MKTAIAKWVKGFQFVTTSPSGHSIAMDAGGVDTGENTAPTPMDLILMGLGGCAGIDVVTILEKQKYLIDQFEVETRGERAADHPMVYQKIWVKFSVKGNVTLKALQKAANLSTEKYCSVSAMLKNSSEIIYEYEVMETS